MLVSMAWVGVGLLALARGLTAQMPDSSSNILGQMVEDLPPSARLRVGALGTRWTGKLAARRPDSLVLADETGSRPIRLAAIDTLWVRSQRHDGLLAGAGFGALMFSLLQVARGSENRAASTRLGAILFVGAATGGMLIDAVSDRWSQRYPE
jgi:hypothetical protein